MANDRSNFDDEAWDKNDAEHEEAQKVFQRYSIIPQMENIATENLGKEASWVSPASIGGYNNLYRLRLAEVEGKSQDIMIRLPQPHLSAFPEEKTLCEAITASFIDDNTQIPVPRVHINGLSPEYGPWIIIDYVENTQSMSEALRVVNEEKEVGERLPQQVRSTAAVSKSRQKWSALNVWFCRGRLVLPIRKPLHPTIVSSFWVRLFPIMVR